MSPNFSIISASKKKKKSQKAITIAGLAKHEMVNIRIGALFGTSAMKINIRALLAKITATLARDLKQGPIYEKAVGAALMVAVLAAIFAETFPLACVIIATLAGMFGVMCYFLRHYK